MLASITGPERAEARRWWESRRLRYNLALAGAGWAAYAAFWLVLIGFGHAETVDIQLAVRMTIVLGVGFLVVMGVANVLYLLGVVVESLARPEDATGFRETFWNLGFYGSIALPFLFPLAFWALQLLGPAGWD